MKTALALLVFTSCLTYGSATFGLLKSKFNSAPAIHPTTRYQPIKYVSSPVVIPEPLPASYARPVPTYTTHVSTYSVSLPTVGKYSTPVSSYGLPHAHEPVFTGPAVVHAQPLAVAYETLPHVHYHGPETVYVEPIATFAAHLVEDHFDDHYANQIGNW